MKVLVSFFCLLGAVFASDVMELTDSDFDQKIPKGTTLVEFFAPWCGHCKKLAPEYEKAATTLKRNDPPVPLAKVDCTENKEVCSKYGVSGYPTLKIFKAGALSSDYNGPRSADGIVSTMKKEVQPASKELDTVEAYEKFITRMEPVTIGFFSDAKNSDAEEFSSIADKLRNDYTFGHSYNAEVAEKAGYSGKVVLYRPSHMKSKFEESVVVMDGKVKESEVKSFLKKNANGLCGHMTTDNEKHFSKPLLTAFYDVDYVKNPKGTNYWRNRVMKVGKEYKDQLSLSIANNNDFGHLLGDMGVTVGEKPAVVIRDDDGKKFVMADEFSIGNLEKFIKDYVDGNLTPNIKSEDIPESNDGPVTVVVGKTFDEIVMDETKDVLIEFYAPWCGHCKSLAPKWDELGEKLKGNDNLVIAKMDATANDSPSQFAVSGFPTIYWAPKNNKKAPVKYNGGREVDDFIKYLDEKASDKLKKTEL